MSSPSSAPAADRGQSVRGAALDAALMDKTHVGLFSGEDFKAYFGADGLVEARVGKEALKGRWEREGEDLFCISWTAPPIPRGCSWMVLDDEGVGDTYKAEDGSLRNTVTVLPGRQM